MATRLGAALVAILLLAFAFDRLFPLPPAPRYSPLVLAADGTVLHAFLNPTQKWRMKTELAEITPALQQAIINKEDRYFRYHFGVNPVAIMQAAGRNIFGRGRTTGASTITMQVARLLEPKERTVGNKLLEMLRALQLEAHYSKAEILQLYLNLVPYGGNIEGVKSAALLYFQQPPDYLSLAQTVTLAIIPNQPRVLVLGKNNAAILAERNRWLRQFRARHLFADQDVADALAEPLDAQRHAAPDLAPHLARRLVTQLPGQAKELKEVLPAIQANPKAAAAKFKAVSPAEGSYVFPVKTDATVTAATPAALQVKVAGLSAETPLLVPLTTAVNGSVLRDAMGFKFADAPDQTRYQYVGDELKKLIQAQVKTTVKNPAALKGKRIHVLGVVSVLDLGSPPPKAKPVNIQPVSVTVTS